MALPAQTHNGKADRWRVARFEAPIDMKEVAASRRRHSPGCPRL